MTGPTVPVSVVIATYRRLELLKETVESVRRQQPAPAQIVVVDDCSQDGTAEWLALQRDVTSIVHTQRSERARSRTDGVVAATQDHVLVLDDDDLLLPGALRRLYRAASRSSVIAVGNWRPVVPQTGRAWWTPLPYLGQPFDELAFGWNPVSAGQVLYPRSLLGALTFRAEYNGVDDIDILLRAVEALPLRLVRAPVLGYRIHPGQQKSPRADENFDRCREEHLARLSPGRASRVRDTQEAKTRFQAALLAQESGNYGEARRELLQLARHHPALLRSRLVGPGLVRFLVSATLRAVFSGAERQR